jgi:hypothetical protein
MFLRAALRRENFTTLRVCVHVFLRLFAQNALVVCFITLVSIVLIRIVTADFAEFTAHSWPFFLVGIAASAVLALQTAYEFQLEREASAKE